MSELKDALERAKEYRTRKAEEQKNNPATAAESKTEQAGGPMQGWSDVVSQRIEEAMRAGEFDNLRNKGKPLKIERNPFVPADMEMANHLLENNDLPPSWITARTEILSAIEKFRTKLRSAPRPDPAIKGDEARWNRQMEAWREELRALNKRIEVTNLGQPIAHLEIFKLVFEEEMGKVSG